MVMADFALQMRVLDGATDFAAGWGSTLPWSENAAGEIVSSPSYPNELMQTQLDLFTADACNGAFSPTRTFWSAWHLCAGRLPMTTCNGDGGPHLVQQSNGQWAQIGITSVGFLVGVGGATDYCKHYEASPASRPSASGRSPRGRRTTRRRRPFRSRATSRSRCCR